MSCFSASTLLRGQKMKLTSMDSKRQGPCSRSHFAYYGSKPVQKEQKAQDELP